MQVKSDEKVPSVFIQYSLALSEFWAYNKCHRFSDKSWRISSNFARICKDADSCNLAASELIKMNVKVNEKFITNSIANVNKCKSSNPRSNEINLLIALAGKAFKAGKFEKSVALLRAIHKSNPDETLNHCLLNVQIRQLLCEIALVRPSDGLEGPIQQNYEAYRDIAWIVQKFQNHEKRNSLWMMKYFKAVRLYLDVLECRSKLFFLTGLSKELRLFTKLQMELTRKASSPLRHASSLLNMAEVDLHCDDFYQAKVKILAVERLLKPVLVSDEPLQRRKRNSGNNNTTNSDRCASPSLFPEDDLEELPLPDWILSHERNCGCFPCSTSCSLALTVALKFYNSMGVYHNLAGHESYSAYFDAASKVIDAINGKRFDLSEGETAALRLTSFYCLSMQFDCFFREKNMSKVNHIAEQNKWILSKLPAEFYPQENASLFEQMRMVRLSEKEEDEFKEPDPELAVQFRRMALSPLPPEKSGNTLTVNPVNQAMVTPARVTRSKTKVPRAPARKKIAI